MFVCSEPAFVACLVVYGSQTVFDDVEVGQDANACSTVARGTFVQLAKVSLGEDPHFRDRLHLVFVVSHALPPRHLHTPTVCSASTIFINLTSAH